MEIDEPEFPTDLGVFNRSVLLLDSRIAVTVLGRQLSSTQVTAVVQCVLDNCL